MLAHYNLKIENPRDIREASKQRLTFCVRIRQPMLLISQIQRSGGTLLSQLLDGHSQLYVHPNELAIGKPSKYFWPTIDLSRPAGELFDNLAEFVLLDYIRSGYQKQSDAEQNIDQNYRKKVLPFIFDFELQKELFVECLRSEPPKSARNVLDAYVTSYFNAWLDYQGLYRDPDQVHYWVNFTARILTEPGNYERIFNDYPDGKFISVLRDPVSWFASARRHQQQYHDIDNAIGLWRNCYERILSIVRSNPGNFLLMKFEDCVLDTSGTMERVAQFLGIRFEESMLTPTFNGMKIQSDSSFGAKMGIDKSSINRAYDVDQQSQNYIISKVGELYDELRSSAEKA